MRKSYSNVVEQMVFSKLIQQNKKWVSKIGESINVEKKSDDLQRQFFSVCV